MSSASDIRTVLENSARPRPSNSLLVGRSNPADLLAVNLILRRRIGAPQLPDPSYWMRTQPISRRYPSRMDFAKTYGAANVDIQQVVTFAQRYGFNIVRSSAARRSVIISGTVAMAERAFDVELCQYGTGVESHRGHDGFVQLEQDVASIIEAVMGLDNRPLGKRSSGGGPGTITLTPVQIAQAYNFWPNQGGAGQTIGIIEFVGGYETVDITQYVSKATGLTIQPTQIVTAHGTNPGSSGSLSLDNPDLEVLLDIDVALSVAPLAKIAVYFGATPPLFSGGSPIGVPDEMAWSTVLQAALHDETNNPKVLSISWGAPEAVWPVGTIEQISTIFAEAATMGITIFAASGDCGASDFPAGIFQDNGKQNVDYPASDPGVTGCGGTRVQSLSPLQQQTWNDAPVYNSDAPSGATGGGVSAVFTNAANYPWQKNVRVNRASPSGRGVPDIAGNASPFSGYDLIYRGERVSTFGNRLLGGTSAVAPFYAGFIAVMNGALLTGSADFQSVGFLNPTLYQIASTNPGIFYEIDDGGNNGFNNVSGYQAGDVSGAGWNACTGLGSVNGLEMQLWLTIQQIPGNPGCATIVEQLIQAFLRSIRGASVSQ